MSALDAISHAYASGAEEAAKLRAEIARLEAQLAVARADRDALCAALATAMARRTIESMTGRAED